MSPRTHSGVVIEDVEALAFGYGIPDEPELSAVRAVWWCIHRQGAHLPAERRIIVHHRVHHDRRLWG